MDRTLHGYVDARKRSGYLPTLQMLLYFTSWGFMFLILATSPLDQLESTTLIFARMRSSIVIVMEKVKLIIELMGYRTSEYHSGCNIL